MRKQPLTPTQVAWLLDFFTRIGGDPPQQALPNEADRKYIAAITKRLCERAEAKAAEYTGPTAAQVQSALKEAAGGFFAEVQGGNQEYWARMQGHVVRKRVTLEQAALVGRHIATQTWRTQPATLQDVLVKWEATLAVASTNNAASGPRGSGGRRAATW